MSGKERLPSRNWSYNPIAGDLPIEILDPGLADPWAGLQALGLEDSGALDHAQRFERPVVIDIGADSKALLLTLDQLGQDGEVIERRQVLISYGEDGLIRPSFKTMEAFWSGGLPSPPVQG